MAYRASRYSRYDPDRRSRSPRDRSPDRFDNDRRRPSTEVRSNASNFPPGRDVFGDGPRREPPRGPRALIDPLSGPRGGGFSGDFRGGRGRGRGRGGWSGREESRDREREREIDLRERFHDDRSRERERERERERDWRDYRSRRSPIGRARSPQRDFRDRERDGGIAGPDADRSRRNSRDGPLSGGSPSSEPPYGMPVFQRGGGPFPRGRGRGGRGDWAADRGRGRAPFDDRGDRYPRSRSQEGRWGREREDRERGDRYLETDPRLADPRRDPRDERDNRADLFRSKKEPRPVGSQLEPQAHGKEVSPPPIAPSAPAFGSVQTGPVGSGKLPPTAPRAFVERPSSGQEPYMPPMGPSKLPIHDPQSIPVGPRAQRPTSKQWINPQLKKVPDSPKMMRAQSFGQQRLGPHRQDGSLGDQIVDEGRPRSSDSKDRIHTADLEDRRRTELSAEPGEITANTDDDYDASYNNRDSRPSLSRVDDEVAHTPQQREETTKASQDSKKPHKERKKPNSQPAKFAIPTKQQPTNDQASESDDDEDMADYFAMEIDKTEAELQKLHVPEVPLVVVDRYTIVSHAAVVNIVRGREGLTGVVDDVPGDLTAPQDKTETHGASDHHLGTATLDDAPVTRDSPEAVGKEDVKPGSTPKPDIAPVSTTPDLKVQEMEIDHTPTQIPYTAAIIPPISAPDDTQAPLASMTPGAVGQLLPEPEPTAPDNEASVPMSNTPLEAPEAGSKPPSTPSQVEDEGDDDETESEDDAVVDVEAVRQYMRTPPLDSLPNFSAKPWYEDDEYQASLNNDDAGLNDYILEHIAAMHLAKTVEQDSERYIYSDNYTNYLKFTASNDPTATKSREKFLIAAPPSEPTGTVTPEPKPEGRTSGRRFASERDLERVLQASMREEDERRERESRAAKEKYRSDREATIPDMLWNADEKMEDQYMDRTGFIPHDKLVTAWQVLPPSNNFTPEEAELFEKRYLEFPKQWGKVAEVIPHRDFGACIQYYYLMKKLLGLKEKLRKQPKRKKKGRGKQRSSALVSELGNGEPEGEENNENGENGESRRRPRRAAAPTWNFEQPQIDSENGTPASTPGRRGASAAAKGEQGEKIDGRKRRKAAKDKDPKGPKINQTLAAAPTSAGGRSRSRPDNKGQNTEFQAVVPPTEQHRLATHFDQQAPGMQTPFAIQKPNHHQPPIQSVERSHPGVPLSSITEAMSTPPSLRPEPPPPPQQQPAMTTFNLAQNQSDRKAPTQASSYWSVSEATDFPLMLRAFGHDWSGIAGHMGSKTTVMVKNYYMRQKDQGKPEWEALVNEAQSKKLRGEKLPEAPQPSISGRGRRYDTTATNLSRPLAAAPGALDHAAEPALVKVETAAPPHRTQPLQGYGVPIAQAAGPQQQQAPSAPPPPPASQQTTSSMSPASRPMRTPLQPFGFTERERERIPLPGSKGPIPPHHQDLREQRQPLQTTHHPDVLGDRQPKMEMQQRELERERLASRVKTEADLPQHHFGHRHQGLPPKADPLSLTRHIQEPPRHSNPAAFPPLQQAGTQPTRSLLSESQPAQPPQMSHPSSRPISALHQQQQQQQQQHQQRQPLGHVQDMYASSPHSAAQTPTPTAAASAPPPRLPEPRKTSNIMSLLNDDPPPPPPKRVSDMAGVPPHSASTPPAQSISRPPSGPAPPSQLRREPEPYSPYGRAPSSGASAMPSLKPTYSGSPPSQHGPSRSFDSPASERDYFRQHHYQPGPQSSGTNSPQNSSGHRYPPPGQPGQVFQSPSAYPSAYGASSQQPPPHAASPPPQYAMHAQSARSREVSQGGREPWQPQGHGQPPPSSGWPSQPSKTSQAPPPQQSWAPQHPTSKAGTPTGSWSNAPPPHQQQQQQQQPPPHHHHPGLRDERGPPMYGSSGAPPSQHQMQGRYAPPPPPASREHVPPPSQAYPRYASTPGPGQPRDPRDLPGRSYTPAAYDTHGRGPPPPSGAAYPGTDPRDLQLRESRDPMNPREMIARGLRPHDYDRHPDHYRQ